MSRININKNALGRHFLEIGTEKNWMEFDWAIYKFLKANENNIVYFTITKIEPITTHGLKSEQELSKQ